jgi:uncharacterized repeat protein (TIGR03803 family)
MKPNWQSGRVVLILASLISIVLLEGIADARGTAYRVIYNFQGSSDGWEPVGVPAVAKNGDLYGITKSGGTYDFGTVYKLTAPRTRGAAWTKTVLYDFPGGAKGGGYPDSLVIGADGNLYGVDYSQTVFELRQPASDADTWKYAALYTLTQGSQGSAIQGNLVFDAEGNLYGAAELGGDLGCEQDGCGTVFELKRPAEEGGKWRLSVLYTFTGTPDGAEPFAGVTFDQEGNLYGTTNYDGAYGYGVVYRVSPPKKKGEAWTETVLYSFDRVGDIGSNPCGPVIFDGSGNMYGTTGSGGDLNCQSGYGCGVVFELSPPTKKQGAWTYATLYAFEGGNDGNDPSGYMEFDSTGNLYSTTQEGGGGKGYSGIAFRLSPPKEKGDGWTESVIHRFVAPEAGGPDGGLTWGKWHGLYGVTSLGGTGCEPPGCGTAFELQP